MKIHLILTTAVMLLMIIFSTTGCSSGGSSSDTNPEIGWQADKKISGLYTALGNYIVDINTSQYGDVNLSKLHGFLKTSQTEYEEGSVCKATETIGFYLDEAQSLRKDTFKEISEELFNRAWMLSYNTLSRIKDDLNCSGVFSNIKRLSNVNVAASDINKTEFTITFSLPKFITKNEGNETFTQIVYSDMPSATTPLGHPDIPYFRRHLLLPKGATPTISSTFKEAQSFKANIYPSQKPLTDFDEEIFFDKNETLYQRDSYYPQKEACSLQIIGGLRSVELLEVVCHGGYTNPVTDVVTIYTSVECIVDFGENNGTVMSEWGASPFESTAVKNIIDSTINANIAQEKIELNSPAIIHGEEFIIITPQEFKDAADSLAEWKNRKGLITRVFTVEKIQEIMNNEANLTKAIDSFIEERYDSMLIKLSYVLLLGDYGTIPYYEKTDGLGDIDRENCINSDRYGFVSDYGYADYHGSWYPFFSLGRVRAQNIEQANYYVENVIRYESAPPYNTSFYQNAVTAGYFQSVYCDSQCPNEEDNESICRGTSRWFIESSEFVRDALISQEKQVERIYAKKIFTDTDYIPTYYNSGELLPDEIGYGSNFTWNGNANDISNAFNDGKFLIIHRDHGGCDGWVDPEFLTEDVITLQNGSLLPVVFSINCLSGDSSFVDRLLIQNQLNPTASSGGAIGIIASIPVTFSGYNDHLIRGLIDAIWPDTLEDYGSINSIKKLGDILLYGKVYMGAQYGADDLGADDDLSYRERYVRHQIRAYHIWGDPTLELWTDNPHPTPLEHDYTIVEETDLLLVVTYTEDAILTAYQETKDGMYPLGRAEVKDGKARISYIVEPIEGLAVLLSASKANLVSVMLTPNMKLSTDSINFAQDTNKSSFKITNSGGGTLSWSTEGTLPTWLTLSQNSGKIESEKDKIVDIYVNRDGLIGGNYTYTLTIGWENGATKDIAITMSVKSEAAEVYHLSKTGQTESYWADGQKLHPGVDGGFVGPNDDGLYEYGVDFDFTNNGNDTITDNNTELVWDRNYAEDLTMAEAESHCAAKGVEWRVPNVYEYLSILDYSKDPALDEVYFNVVNGYYWTSTNAAESTSRFWTLRERFASLSPSWDTTNNIRCVKGEELTPLASGRFTKIDASGLSLDDSAAAWTAVKDNWTGLLWQKSDNGTTLSWEDAIGHCENLTLAGKNWHLPNIKQMHTVMDMTQEDPALNPLYFSVSDSNNVFWTSTTDMFTISTADYILAWAVQQYHAADVMAGIAKTDTESYNAHTAICVSWD